MINHEACGDRRVTMRVHAVSRLMRAFGADGFPHQLSWLLDNPIRRLFVTPEELAHRLSILPQHRILEIGPGSGYFSVELARRVPMGRLELFDLQPEMLAKARRKLERHGLLNVGYFSGNASADLPYRDGFFDWAVLVTVLGEVFDRSACVRSVHRVLRPHGSLAVHEHLPDPDFVPFQELRSDIEAYDFKFRQRWGRRWNYTATFEKCSENQ